MNSESVGAGRLHPKIFDTMRIRVFNCFDFSDGF